MNFDGILIGVLEGILKNSEFRSEKLDGLGIAVCFTGKTFNAKLRFLILN